MIEAALPDYRLTKTLMLSEPKLWAELMGKVSASLENYLLAQVRAGPRRAAVRFLGWRP